MNPIKEKLVECMEEAIKDPRTISSEIYLKLNVPNNLAAIELLNFYSKNLKNENNLFTCSNYDNISAFIEYFDFPINKASKLIFAFVEDDINLDRSDRFAFTKSQLSKHRFTTISQEDLFLKLKNGELGYILNPKDINQLTEREKLIREELTDYIEKNYDRDSVQKTKENALIIKKHYFDKLDTYTEEDILQVGNALINLGVHKKLSNDITIYLKNQIGKRIPNKVDTKPVSIKKFYYSLNLSRKEYNLINQELKSYFDLDNMRLARPLAIREVYYCIFLLKKLNQSDEVIQKFLKLARQENNKQNIIAQYYYSINKIAYYCKQLNLENKLADLKECFTNYGNYNEVDKESWYSLLEESLNDLKSILPNDGKYEEEFVKKLVNARDD